ncbi:stalk domain-containing protein [uncultured Tyzzerella sp.]|uniref:stalk domain-containing protein n=1 Tax=uncultured Tyzzerella sp. TaxID=2321398 RepID=UPI0029428F85|nr:stalk domain-containing protein [uncultured Tyzzerella sp.]
MKTIFIKLYLFLNLIIFMSVPINAQTKIKLWINNNYIKTDVPPEIYNERTYVPVRVISQTLGYNVEWLEETREIKINNDSINLILKINSQDYIINNEVKKSDVSPIIVNGRTLVPVRLIAESFNETINWDQKNKTVAIGNNYENFIYEEATVTKTVDGDTIEVDINGNIYTVRLIGVNTPETKHPKKGVEYYGKEASNFTKNQLNGKKIYLQKDASDTDKYGRLLRFVWLNKPANITPTKDEIEKNMFNSILVKNGYANVSTYPPNVGYQQNFIELEKIAREKNLGLWKNNNIITEISTENTTTNNIKQKPVIETSSNTGKIKGNKNSKIYHLQHQQYYNKIKPENIVYFDTEQEAINAGYRKSKK